jgi:hypothetical protein
VKFLNKVLLYPCLRDYHQVNLELLIKQKVFDFEDIDGLRNIGLWRLWLMHHGEWHERRFLMEESLLCSDELS